METAGPSTVRTQSAGMALSQDSGHLVRLVLPGGNSTVSNASSFPSLFNRIMTTSSGRKAVELQNFHQLFHLLDVHDHQETIERRLNGQQDSGDLPVPYADAVRLACSVRGDAVFEDVLIILEDWLRVQLAVAETIQNMPCPGSPRLTLRLLWS